MKSLSSFSKICGEKSALFSLTFPFVYSLNFASNKSVSMQSFENKIAIFLKRKIILFENQLVPIFLVIWIIILTIKLGS